MWKNVNTHRRATAKHTKLLAQAIEQSPVPIIITDVGGHIEYANPRFTVLTGYQLQEVMGKNTHLLSAGKTRPEVYKNLWDTILAGEVWEGDLCNKRKNGEEFWESISISPIKNTGGAITHFIGIWQDATSRKHAEDDLKRRSHEFENQSITDDLTGIYNRRHILEELDREIERALRYGRHLSGMMLDIDDFKNINDRYGHLVGDRVIRAFATLLQRSIRKVDILGRYGGDEFLVILPEAMLDAAKKVAQRIQKNLSEYEHNVLGDLSRFTTSVGLASYEGIQKVDKATFIEKIDQALLQAKQLGKNRIFPG